MDAYNRSFFVEDSVADPRHYLALLKPRVMSMAVFTAAMGMLAAPAAPGFNWILGVVAMVAIAVGGGAAGALNMWYEANLDGKMARTAKRPLPAGLIAGPDALGLGAGMAVASVTLLFLATNWQAAAWLAFIIAFYLFIYTMWLKPMTPHNIVIGGLAGALPPLVGWVAASGELSVYPWLMVAIIFFWTPPHSWALALFTGRDYQSAGVPMLPVVAGVKVTCRRILAYAAAMTMVGISPYWLGFAGLGYLAAASAGGGLMLFHAVRLLLAEGRGEELVVPAKSLFRVSLAYLPLIFAAVGLGI